MGKTIVLCFDGTSDQYSAANTNVVRLFATLEKNLPSRQLCYYQSGIGTYFNPGVVSPALTWAAKILDEAFAWYLYQHVTDGYRFLMDNYEAGDRVCLFGFSRGAYTARALAGYLHKIGLLPKGNEAELVFAYKLYASTKSTDLALAAGYKKAFCREVCVDFLGAWDTVASTGVVAGKNLPFTDSTTSIKVFRQALALDEHRIKFLPNLWHREASTPEGAIKDPNHASSPHSKRPALQAQRHRDNVLRLSQEDMRTHIDASKRSLSRLRQIVKGAVKGTPGKSDLESAPIQANVESVSSSSSEDGDRDDTIVTNVREVWFAGVHSDVGGGSSLDTEAETLAGPPLRWMVREALAADCGLLFVPGALAALGCSDVESCAQDAKDALAPEHDALAWRGGHPAWWILEIIPLRYSLQDRNGNWVRKWTIHLGRGREITQPAPLFHSSVETRMTDTKLKYKPRAHWEKGTQIFTF